MPAIPKKSKPRRAAATDAKPWPPRNRAFRREHALTRGPASLRDVLGRDPQVRVRAGHFGLVREPADMLDHTID